MDLGLLIAVAGGVVLAALLDLYNKKDPPQPPSRCHFCGAGLQASAPR
jgi:hypothetical protein